MHWYNTTRHSQLILYLIVPRDTEETRKEVISTIEYCRLHKCNQKPDPLFRVIAPAYVDEEFTTFIVRLDWRLPRIMLMPTYSDKDGFNGLANDILKTATIMQRHLVFTKFLITVERPQESIPHLLDQLATLKDDNYGNDLLTNFPVIELPFACTIQDPIRLIESVARIWSKWPQLNESINASRDGYIKHFYALKEHWYLAEILGRALDRADLARLRSFYNVDAVTQCHIAAFDEAFLTRYASLAQYNQWRYQRNKVVLAFDVDSIADTLECQSPVFIDKTWISANT